MTKSGTNFWQQLIRPFTVLAPMDGVTDVAFRAVLRQVGRPDVFMTEFVSCDALISAGSRSVSKKLLFDPDQRPIVVQLWSSTSDSMYKGAKMVSNMGFAGIDINMGCPQRVVVRCGGGAALIKQPRLAGEIIQAAIEGANGLPVSVKTRLGYDTLATNSWISFLMTQNIQALTLHGRTVAEQSKPPAHWDEIASAVRLKAIINPNLVFVGNGDVKSYGDVLFKTKQYGVDGVMIGRGVFNDPWVFNRLQSVHTPTERLDLLKLHIDQYRKHKLDPRGFNSLKKFVKMYVCGFVGAAELRDRLMKSQSLESLEQILLNYP